MYRYAGLDGAKPDGQGSSLHVKNAEERRVRSTKNVNVKDQIDR